MHQTVAYFQKLWDSLGFWGLVLFSCASVVISFALLIFTVVIWPPDRFTHTFSKRQMKHPILAICLIIARNVVGTVIIVLGLFLVIPGVPGQGLLTIVVGLTWVDFVPYKFQIERNLVQRKGIRQAIDKLRMRFGRPPLEM